MKLPKLTRVASWFWTPVPMISWWRHQMETFSALLALCAGNSPHKCKWRGALMFFLIFAWIIGWVNSREAGDLKRHRAQYDVTIWRSRYQWIKYVKTEHIQMVLSLYVGPAYFGQTRSISVSRQVTWWRNQMETFSALLAFCAGNSPVNSPHKGKWRGAFRFLWSVPE